MKLVALFAAALAIAACSSKDSGTAAPTTAEVKFTTLPYTLKPGDEKYFCYTMNLDADAIVTELTPTYGKATHHFGLYYTIADEPAGFSECPLLIKTTWVPLYGGGKDSGTLKLPDNAGFKLKKGQQLLIQLHLLNATKEDVTDTGAMTMKTTADPNAPFTKAGMFGFDNRDLTVPAKSTGVEQSMDCTAPFDMDVFAVFGHMHTLGKHIEVSRGPTAGAEVLYSSAWNFDQQPTTPLSFHVKKGDSVHLRCQWDNPTDTLVKYGESTHDEMCSFVWYYTPYEQLDGCLKTPTGM
ncbi:MAG: monooxygenase [Polyangiales bacterium]